MEEKYVLEYEDIKKILGNVGRDKIYNMLFRASKTNKPFPVLTKKPYRVPKEPFLEALNKGLIKM